MTIFDKKIAIIGAGASGLSAAYYLKKKGYKNIIVFEKENRLGGKCHTILYKNKPYDVGAVFAPLYYKSVLSLAKEFNCELNAPTRHNAFYDLENNRIMPFSFVRSHSYYCSFLAYLTFLKLLIKYRYVKNLNNRHYPPEIVQPFASFIQQYKLEPLTRIFEILICVMGYGSFKNISTVDVLKYLAPVSFSSFFLISMAHTKFRYIKEFTKGYQNLWESVVNNNLNVELNADVQAITHSNNGKITLQFQGKKEIVDVLIVSVSIDQLYEKFKDIDLSFIKDKVEYVDYTSFLFHSKGEIIFPGNLLFTPSTFDGAPLVIKKFYPDEDVYLTYAIYEDKKLSLKDKRENLLASLKKIGMTRDQIRFIRTISWKYYPHYSLASIKENIPKRILDLQGKNNLYFIGSLVSFETVNDTVNFSKAFIDQYF